MISNCFSSRQQIEQSLILSWGSDFFKEKSDILQCSGIVRYKNISPSLSVSISPDSHSAGGIQSFSGHSENGEKKWK
jgi:hypothetical protein